jgi:hypothetical protein
MYECSLQNLSEVFEKFEASKVLDASVVLFNEKCGLGFCESYILQRYGYVVIESIAKKQPNMKRKMFFAERYGGDFISTNGGGGRCGYDGLFQLKGVGKTPLLGSCDDLHSNGMLDLDSAIHEFIWGEIIHIALPFGAARSVAVIILNEKFTLDGEVYNRALLVREAAIRPAHFERATLFKEKLTPGAPLSNDALRVKNCIQRINDFLPHLYDIKACESAEGIKDLLLTGMAALAVRFAEQFAVARCKNIMHMMMSSSNLTMSGGWLDLNSATVVSPMSVREKRLFKRFESEHISVIRSLENICYYAKKYLPLSDECATEIFRNAMAEFEECYELTLRKNAIIRAGFPQCVVGKMVESGAFRRFSDLLMRLMRNQTYELGVEQAFGGLRFYSVPERPNVSGCNVDEGLLNIHMDWRVSDRHLRGKLDEAFKLFFIAVLQKTEISRTQLTRILCINLTRYSRTPVLLQNIKLYECIKNFIRGVESGLDFRGEINSLMCESRDAAEICLSTDERFSALVWKSGNDYIEYDGVVGRFCIVQDGQCDFATWAQLVELTNVSMVRGVVDFYEAVRGAFIEI